MRTLAASIALVGALGAAEAAGPTFCNEGRELARVWAERKAWTAKLRERRLDELQAFFGGLQRDYEAGTKSDAQVRAWYFAFDDADPGLGPPLEEWVAAQPGSYPAKLAHATHLHAVAWARRGDGFSSQTTPAQKDAMRKVLARMLMVLHEADKQTPRPGLSYPLRINQAALVHGHDAARAVFERAERIDPYNADSKAAYIHVISPKWQGPAAYMDELVQRARTGAWPPDLTRYVGYEMSMVVGEAFDIADKRAEAIPQYERAARNCSAFVAPLERLVELHRANGNAEAARDAARRALELYAMVPDAERHARPQMDRLRREMAR